MKENPHKLNCFNLMKRIWKKGILQSWSYGARCRTLCPGQSFSMDKSPGCTRVTGMPASGFQTSKPGHESVNPVHTAPTCLEHFSITGFPVSAFPLQFSTASSTLEISVGQFCGERGREVWYKCVVSQEWCVPPNYNMLTLRFLSVGSPITGSPLLPGV